MRFNQTFNVTALSYDESIDTLTARIEDPGFAITIEVIHQFGVSVSARFLSDTTDAEPEFLPTVLNAFCKSWQLVHDAQNPGGSPADTNLTQIQIQW